MNKTHHNLLYNMDTSSSSEELSSSDCDIESSCDDDSEKLETAKICGATLDLPQGLCESKEIFKEFFSQKTWNSLSEINKQHLKNFLPCFPENDDQEKNVTIQKLLNKERFRFNSPLMQFQEKLNAGHFRPDIAKMRSLVKHAQRKEHKYQQQQHYKNLLNDLVGSRQRLLDVSNSLPPGVEPRVEKHCTTSPAAVCPASYRAKRRYFQELATIKSLVGEGVDLSEDENYPEGPPVQLSKKQRRHLNGLQGNTNPSPGVERAVTSTLATKPTGLDLEYSITSTHNPYQLNEDAYRALLTKHKKRKLEYDISPEMITKGISLRDIAQRTQLTPTKKSNGKPAAVPNNEHKTTNKKKIKVEPGYRPVVNNVTTNYSPETVKPHASALLTSTLPSSNSEPEYSDSDSFIDPVMSPLPAVAKSKNPRARTPKPKQSSPRSSKGKTPPVNTSVTDFEPVKIKTEFEPIKIKTDPDMSVPCTSSLSLSTDNLVSPISQYGNRIVPATLSDLDGIDMMNLPVDLDDSNIDILEEINVKQELMQDTHANFLSLVRDIICSTMDHRMSMSSLEDRLKAWQENPISPLNDWYSLVDSWVSLLSSAVTFLTGESNEQPEDFVPYLEFKPMLHAYQWIGAGRDSDNLLSPLCQYWLEHRDDTALQNNTQDIEIDVVEKPQTPPPPRCPTQWSVRKAEPEEVDQFREQERQRYSNPHKAFTYRMNGYESVVGPVKGMYNQSAGVSKARGHSMLNADRPNFVTILTLVRDATARLPNGEGTRAEICELLKSSQYISQTAPENVLQSVVSGALDRMHTEFDPCVKYDTKRKIWIYLHRNRSEADFERIHQQCQGMSKQLKKATRKPKAKPNKEKPVKQNANKNATESQPTAAASATPAASVEKAPKAFKTPVCRVFTVPTVSATNTIVQTSAAATPSRQAAGTSLLVNSNATAVKSVSSPKPTIQLQTVQDKVEPGSSMKTLLAAPIPTSSQANASQSERQVKIVTATIAPTKQDIEEAIQTLTPIRVTSPITKQISSPKPGKSLVKIINSPQGKSLITSQAATGQQQQQTVFIKQVEQKTVNAKQLLTQPQITQQLLQSIAAQQQKQLKNTQQQIVQISQQKQATVTTQQLLKTVEQKPIQTIASPHLIQTITHQPQQTTTVTQANISQQLLQAITQQKQNQVTTLTSAQQQQQILQTLKQKVAQQNQQTVLTVQQAVLKQQANIHQLQKQLQQQQLAKGTSLLGQQRILAQVGTAKTAGSQNQTPLVAKVLTNAAGQVISVESLLAHQKQHGSLPQGTTLRVSGAKPGQTNLIQLSGTSPNQVAQFAVVSQNNIVSIAGQQRLISTVTSQPPTTTSTVTVVTTAKALTKNHTKPQTPTKFVSSKLTHQLVNAKFIQNVGNNKLVQQQKIVVNQQNQIKINAAMKPVAVTKTVSSSNQTGNTVRMVNAAGLNLAHIAGKPVLLASKGNTIQNIQGQNVILQAQPSISTSSGSIVLPNNARVIQGGSMVTQQSQSVQQSQGNAQVVLGTQLKVQNVGQNVVQTNTPHVVLGHNLKPQSTVSLATQQSTQNQTVVLGGHTIKMQTGTQSNQRVVLASQGQGGQLVAQQILLPPGFQGGAINIKTLQGLKVIPLAQTQQTKGRPQQVFARIMNPGSASRITQVTSTQSTSQIDGGGNQGNKE